MVEVKAVLRTDGSGLYCSRSVAVPLLGIEVTYTDDEKRYGELLVYFDTLWYDVDTNGIIYTDQGFLDGLKQTLTDLGLNAEFVYYSEWGMQGNTFVSLDIGEPFITSWIAKGYAIPEALSTEVVFKPSPLPDVAEMSFLKWDS